MTDLTTGQATETGAVLTAHQCQNACGRLADVVIVTLADSAVDIFCSPCHLAMMMAVAQQIVETAPVDEQTEPV